MSSFSQWMSFAREKWRHQRDMLDRGQSAQTRRTAMTTQGGLLQARMQEKGNMARTQLTEQGATARKQMGEMGQTFRTNLTNQTTLAAARAKAGGETGMTPYQVAQLRKDAFTGAGELYDENQKYGRVPKDALGETVPRQQFVQSTGMDKFNLWTHGLGQPQGGQQGGWTPQGTQHGAPQGEWPAQGSSPEEPPPSGLSAGSPEAYRGVAVMGHTTVEDRTDQWRQRQGEAGKAPGQAGGVSTRPVESPTEQAIRQTFRANDGGEDVRAANRRIHDRDQQQQADQQRTSLPDDVTLDRLAEVANARETSPRNVRETMAGARVDNTRESIADRAKRAMSQHKPGKGYGQTALTHALERSGIAPENRRIQKNMADRLRKAFPNVPEEEIALRIRQPEIQDLAENIASQADIDPQFAEEAVMEAMRRYPDMSPEVLMRLILRNVQQ